MKCQTQSLIELADRFIRTLQELTCEVHELNNRVSELENQNPKSISITGIDKTVSQLKTLVKEVNDTVGHK